MQVRPNIFLRFLIRTVTDSNERNLSDTHMVTWPGCLFILRSQTAESNLQHFRLNFFASYFLISKESLLHSSFKIAQFIYSVSIALNSLCFPLPAVRRLTYKREAETRY
jgi:hypothetical protein